MQYDDCLGIDLQDPVDPDYDVAPFVIAVAHVGALALSVPAQVRHDHIHSVNIAVNHSIDSHALRRVRIAVHAEREAMIASLDRAGNKIGVNAKSVLRSLVPVLLLGMGVHPFAACHVRLLIGLIVAAGVALYRFHGKVVEIVRNSDHHARAGAESCPCGKIYSLAHCGFAFCLLNYLPDQLLFCFFSAHIVMSLHLPVTAVSCTPSP